MTDDTLSDALAYRDAGVDIEAGNRLVDVIKPFVRRTHRPGVIGGIGGFGGLFELPEGQWTQPVFVSGTDGVGTKLRLAIDLDIPDTVGIDLVAMCVNDIVVTGAEPLWFLDYFATGKLQVDHAARVMKNIGTRFHRCTVWRFHAGQNATHPNTHLRKIVTRCGETSRHTRHGPHHRRWYHGKHSPLPAPRL